MPPGLPDEDGVIVEQQYLYERKVQVVGDETGKAAPSAEQVTTHLSTLDQNMGQMQGQISSVETQLRVLNGTVAQFVSALSPQPASGGETAEALTNAAARLEGVARQKTERSAVDDESVEWSRRALITGFVGGLWLAGLIAALWNPRPQLDKPPTPRVGPGAWRAATLWCMRTMARQAE